MIDRAPLVAFARRSPWALLFTLGAGVLAVSAAIGTSMISLGHLAGSALACTGLLGLGLRGQLSAISWRPARGFFLALLSWVTASYAVQVWAYYWSGVFATYDLGIFADLLASLGLRGR